MSDQDPFILLLRLLHAADEAIARENFAEPQEHSANSTPTVPPPAIDLTTPPSSIVERLAQTEKGAKSHKCKELETLELRVKQMEKAGKVKVTPKSEE